jgi:hypothetical protein
VILIKIPKKATKKISNHRLEEIFSQFLIANGKKINPAKKKRLKAKVNGGIFSKANLNTGEAAPQIMLVMIKARTGDIKLNPNY